MTTGLKTTWWVVTYDRQGKPAGVRSEDLDDHTGIDAIDIEKDEDGKWVVYLVVSRMRHYETLETSFAELHDALAAAEQWIKENRIVDDED